MERTLDLCRWTYNQTLAYRKNAWENEGKSVSKYETNALLPGWKEDKPELRDVYAQTLQNVQERVDLAFKAFFRRLRREKNPDIPDSEGRVGTIHLLIHNLRRAAILLTAWYVFPR